MSHTALINKGWPGLLRQELTTYEMYSGTVSKKTVTRVFDHTGRYYDSNNEFSGSCCGSGGGRGSCSGRGSVVVVMVAVVVAW